MPYLLYWRQDWTSKELVKILTRVPPSLSDFVKIDLEAASQPVVIGVLRSTGIVLSFITYVRLLILEWSMRRGAQITRSPIRLCPGRPSASQGEFPWLQCAHSFQLRQHWRVRATPQSKRHCWGRSAGRGSTLQSLAKDG